MSSLTRLRGIFSPQSNILKPASSLNDNLLKPPQTFEQIVENFKKFSDKSRFRRRVKTYEYTVLRLAKAQKFSMIEEILEAQKKYKNISSEGFVVRLISLYGKAGMFDHARALFDEMPQLKCPRTVLSFCALLSACVDAKKFNKVEELFRELPPKLSIEANPRSYNIVIDAFCEMGSLDSARSMLEEMEKNGVESNVVTFGTLLHGFYTNNQYAKGEKIWALMQSRNIAPDIWTYNARLRGMVSGCRISEAVSLIDEMKSKGIKLNTISFNTLIIGFCRDGKLEEAKKWYEELLKNECVPDRITYMILIPFLCKEGDFDKAFELCKEAISHGILINVQKVKHVVEGLNSKGMTEEAKELVALARKKKFRMDLLQVQK